MGWCLLIVSLLRWPIVADVFLQGELYGGGREGVAHGRALGELHVHGLDGVGTCPPGFVGDGASVDCDGQQKEDKCSQVTHLVTVPRSSSRWLLVENGKA